MKFLKIYLKVLSILLIVFFLIGITAFLCAQVSPVVLIIMIPVILAIPLAYGET